MVTSKKYSLKDIRSKRHLMKSPGLASVRIVETPNLVGLRTRRPTLMGMHSLITINGNIRPYLRYLKETDVTDMISDWALVGSDIITAMKEFRR